MRAGVDRNGLPREARVLRDEILAEVRLKRGVALRQESLTVEHGMPVLRVRIGDRVLRGVQVRLPALPGPALQGPDVITVHGSGHRTSRTWPRKIDGTFAIGAVVDHLLGLVQTEVERPRPDLSFMAHDVPAAASALHVVHTAAIVLGTVTPDTKADDLVGRVGDEEHRAQMLARTRLGGLTDADLRVLSEVAGLFHGRARKLDDFDPFEPINDRILKVLRFGQRRDRVVERRHVLLLDRLRDQVTIADPAGEGVTTMSCKDAEAAWKLGGVRGIRWLGTLSRSTRRQP